MGNDAFFTNKVFWYILYWFKHECLAVSIGARGNNTTSGP